MILPVIGSLFFWVAGYAVYEKINEKDHPQTNTNYQEYYDDKEHKEIWCDCFYIAKCKNDQTTDSLAGYRGRGYKEAKRNSCRTAKSYATLWCFQQQSEIELFAEKEHKCYEDDT